jgi:hypothetical protein
MILKINSETTDKVLAPDSRALTQLFPILREVEGQEKYT